VKASGKTVERLELPTAVRKFYYDPLLLLRLLGSFIVVRLMGVDA
jgi:hypothetical protein